MAKVLIHVGSHKTGTTLVQSVLAGNRDALQARGVYYPKTYEFFGDKKSTALSANAHFELPKALALYTEQDRAELAAFKDHLHRIKSQYSTIVLSAETFYRMLPGTESFAQENLEEPASVKGKRSAVFRRLAELLDGFDTEIICYFRRPDSFAESMYAEGIVNGKSGRTFAEFLEFQKFRFDYGAQLATFGEFFPVRDFVFEDRIKGGLLDNVFADLGLGAAFADDGLMNRASVPKPAVLWLQRCKLDARIPKRAFNARRLFAHLPENRVHFGGAARFGFWPSLAERDAFNTAALQNVPHMKFPPPPETLATQCTWTDQQHRQTERLFKAWRKSEKSMIQQRRKARVKPFVIPQNPEG
nr:hypothetical protein [Amylibacter sp.]